MTRLLPLFLTGCLVGVDHLKNVPNTPTLDGAVVLLAPEPGPDGAFAREGDRVEIAFSTLAAIEPEASTVTLDGFPMDFAGSDGFTYRYQRTLDGSEGSSPKTVTGTLRNAAERQGALGSPLLLETDFIPPTASCVLNPRSANANDAITFVVTPSEPLREPPAITPSASELTVTFREQVEGQFFYDLEGEPDTNLDGYVLTVEAFDRAGNPQRGDSLCEVEDRSGALLGRGPALDGDVTLTAVPSVEVGGVPWVRDGAVLTVSIPTAEPIDAGASSVALSGLDLAPVADAPNTWTFTLDGTEGDGFKNLDAVLFDAAGNTLRVQRPAITRFDFTPPTADCVLSPREANGEQAVTFDVFASEPLDGGAPTVTPSDARITLTGPTTTGNQHRYAVSGPPGEDVVYTLDVQGTDLAGNPADGPLCPEEDASGAIRGRGPEVVGDIVVSLEPSVDIDGVPSARAGAELRVTIPTAQAVDPGRSIISLSGVPLVHDDTQPGTWTRTLDGTEGDGLKRLDARLFDAAGNNRQEIRDDVVRFDFTPPSGACSVTPSLANRSIRPVFSFTPNEPLLHGPQVFSSVVAVSAPALEGGRWTNELRGPPVGNVDYTLQITAIDRVGNTASGDEVCPEADRQGQIFNQPPVATGVVLSVSGPSTHTPASGPPRVGLGAVVEVTLTSDSALDPAATTVQVGEIRLTHTEGLTWRHTVAEGDLDGLKTLAVSLVDVAGNTAPADGAGQGVVIDLTPPEASCVLSPSLANADDTITLDVFVSETLPAAPVLDVGGAPLSASSPTLTGNRYRYTLTQTASANLSYQLSLSATDIVGNPQDGDSLCEPDSRSGAIQGVGPALQGAEVALTVAPSTYTDSDGRPWAKAGDTVTVTFDVVDPSALDTALSSVALSGLELTPDTTGTTWTVTLDGSEGDGAKNLNARLVDTAGNALVVTRTAVTRFDFTPPAGACFLAPNPANGTQTVTFAFTPTETLDGPPVLTSPAVTLDSLAFDGTRWTATVVAPPAANTTYTVGIEATDVVGNTATGAAVCPEADRTGQVFAVPPELDGEPTLTVVSGPQATDPDAIRVGTGALVRVAFNTLLPIDPATSTVQLGDLPLVWDPGLHAWQRTIQTIDADGRKALALTLFDASGNRTDLARPDLAIRVDQTPPVATCILAPTPANAAQAAAGLSFEVRANEPLTSAPTLVSSDGRVSPAPPSNPSGNIWRSDLTVSGLPADFTFTLDATATDRVGNTAAGDDLCAEDDRSGEIQAEPPAIIGEPVLVATPSVDVSGTPWVGAGATIEVSLTPTAPIDPAATAVSLSGLELSWVSGTTWTVILDGTEGDGLKNLDIRLRDALGNTTPVLREGVIAFDFTPPDASCVLNPQVAGVGQTTAFEVRANEPLAEASVTSSDPQALVTAGTPSGNNFPFTVAPDGAVNVDYVLSVDLTDLVGNTATDLCPLDDRSGSLRNVAPALSADPVLTVAPSTYIDGTGRPWAKAGNVVTVTLNPATPLDLDTTTVSLSGLPLTHQGGTTWAVTLDGSEGDGTKELRVELRDEAGNLTVITRADAVRFDFTPPTASCVLFPPVANGEDAVTLQVFASEELLTPPTPSVDHPDVAVALNPTSSGNPHLFDVSLTAPIDVPTYTVTLIATDLVGNAQSGASLCSESSRTGAFFGVPPVLSGDITLTATPSIDEGGIPRAAAGATVTVTIPTEQPISPSRSFVSLSGFALSSTNGTTWTGTLDPILGDGLKTLTATLVDGAGNTLVVQDPTVAVIADFTPPQAASAVLTRTPFFAPAEDGQGTVYFRRQIDIS